MSFVETARALTQTEADFLPLARNAPVKVISIADYTDKKLLTDRYDLGSHESHHAQTLLDDYRMRQSVFVDLADGYEHQVQL